MTRRSDNRRALLHETYTVEQLNNELTRQAVRDGTVDDQSQRRYLVLRAALADRASSVNESNIAITSEVDAALAAFSLVQWDREHGSGRGPVAAAEPQWDTTPLRYVHQEHAVLVLDEQDEE